MMKKPLLVLAVAAVASPALDAKTYSCGESCYTDNSKASKGRAKLGNQIGYYTSVKPTPPKTETVAAERKNVVPAPRAVQVAARSAPSVPATPRTVAVAPRVNPAKISGRRTILEQELNNERDALAAAQKALADGRVVANGKADANHQNHIRQLESVVLDRQQNIQSIQRELSRM